MFIFLIEGYFKIWTLLGVEYIFEKIKKVHKIGISLKFMRFQTFNK